ncbi:MAG TPA: hypothetical protein VM821_06760 [Abditibacteriaceae bacterium]|nr:hypothetical protein [Abditibacteriaceae bacterium]
MAKENSYQPEKLVINAGPTFGSALSFMLLGALIGSAATYYLSRHGEMSAQAELNDSLRATESGAEKLKSRLSGLSSRVKDLTFRAKDAAQSFSETVRPAFHEAVQEGKAAARETSDGLAEDLQNSKTSARTRKPFDDLAEEEA